jgi:hypothetical protein
MLQVIVRMQLTDHAQPPEPAYQALPSLTRALYPIAGV